MIGNIITIIIALIVIMPCLYIGIKAFKEQPTFSLYYLFVALVVAGIAAKIVGV